MEDMTLRPAHPDDAGRASLLLYSAYTHKQITYPPSIAVESQFLTNLQHFFRQRGNRFSYQCVQVAEQSAEIVGLILSFGGRVEKRLNAAVGWRLTREAHNDEWYVDALAVFANWGSQGVGTYLLQAAEQQARAQHYAKIALHVAEENQQALALYQRLHYVITRKTVLYHQPHLRLVKRLENT